jgi:hypothetical protein
MFFVRFAEIPDLRRDKEEQFIPGGRRDGHLQCVRIALLHLTAEWLGHLPWQPHDSLPIPPAKIGEWTECDQSGGLLPFHGGRIWEPVLFIPLCSQAISERNGCCTCELRQRLQPPRCPAFVIAIELDVWSHAIHFSVRRASQSRIKKAAA